MHIRHGRPSKNVITGGSLIRRIMGTGLTGGGWNWDRNRCTEGHRLPRSRLHCVRLRSIYEPTTSNGRTLGLWRYVISSVLKSLLSGFTESTGVSGRGSTGWSTYVDVFFRVHSRPRLEGPYHSLLCTITNFGDLNPHQAIRRYR